MDTKNLLLNPDQHENNNNLQGVAEEEYGQEKGDNEEMQTQRSKKTKKVKKKVKKTKTTAKIE